MAKNQYAKFIWMHSDIPEQLGFTDQLDYAFAKTCRDLMKPYVPYDTGQLAKRNRITKSIDGEGYDIVYDSPYATAMYSGAIVRNGQQIIFNYNKSVHPLATHHWDRAMLVANKEKLVSIIEAELK